MITALVRRSVVVVVALGATSAVATAQSLADRVARVHDGTVHMSFALRPGVCGYGTNISTMNGNHTSRRNVGDGSRRSRDVEYDIDCESGPGRLVLEMDGGQVSDLRFYVGGRWRPSDATDLGEVSAKAAADFLLSLASTSDSKVGRAAIFPATVVDSTIIWPSLLRIARDESRPSQTRRDAVFWLGQAAEAPATKGLDDLVGEASLDREVREQAIFALSQRPHDEGVPALIRVVKTNRDPDMRKKALFWLGQSGDKRALDLIEELLTKGA